ncbi:MAG: LysR family transcriptional regulator [Rhodobacteraceae bacterium]|nr:LysR family transcriptional regulator [Paracoccaceae bacterium]
MENWDEVRTAYQVARMGTVSGAAEILGVHHATVIRHVDAIEARLGVKLFQRHARGYTPTEAGQDLMRVAQATEDQLNQLSGRIKGQGDEVTGDLVVTSLALLAPLIVPALTAFQHLHDGLTVRYLTSDRLFRLEYGEAHVAIRAGRVPDQPDNVVQPFLRQRFALYASGSYVRAHGKPNGIEDYGNHIFVGADDQNNRAPFSVWLRENVPTSAVRFRGSDIASMTPAVLAGAGIGFLPVMEAQANPELIEIHPPIDDWSTHLWLVTHVDLHRTNKVQSFLSFLKSRARDWDA